MSVFARCEQTWVDGRQYFSAERDQQMREANAKTRSRLIQKLLATGPKKTDGAKPGEGTPGPAGAPGGRRRRPTDDLTAGAAPFDTAFDNSFDDASTSSDDTYTNTSSSAGDSSDSSTTPRRSSLMDRMARQAAEARREHYLQLWRRGIDPTWSRCGDCGESFGTR